MCWVAHYRGCVKAQDSARPWMQAAEVAACSCPALVRSALLCASVSGAFRPSSHWREHRCVCGTSCWAPATKLPTFKRIWSCWEELGPAGLFSIFLSRRGGKKPGGLFFILIITIAMRWTYQNLKWGVLLSSFCCEILLTGGKRSPPQSGFLDRWRSPRSWFSPCTTDVCDVEAAGRLLYRVGAAVPVICCWEQSAEL